MDRVVNKDHELKIWSQVMCGPSGMNDNANYTRTMLGYMRVTSREERSLTGIHGAMTSSIAAGTVIGPNDNTSKHRLNSFPPL
eukprot:2756624-Prorocentrum_lima.AAC.1